MSDPSPAESADRAEARSVAGPAQPARLGLAFAKGVPVLVLDELANIEGLRASIRVHLPAHQPAIAGQSVRLDLGSREINLFDLRRIVHLLKQDYGTEVTGLYVRGAVVHRFAERELKLKLFPTTSVRRSTSSVDEAPPDDPTEELDDSSEPIRHGEVRVEAPRAPPPAVLAPAPPPPRHPVPVAAPLPPPRPAPDPLRSVAPSAPSAESTLARLTLPHDLQPEDLPRKRPSRPPAPIAPPTSGAFTGPPVPAPTRTQTLHRTLRSGTVLRFDGDVTIFGDVNPGGQVVARGNVVVLGALKGQVHAGCDGDESAFVLAMDLRPTQIRIGSHIATPGTGRIGSGGSSDSGVAEMASIRDGDIVIEPYRPSRENGSSTARPRHTARSR